MADPLRGLSTGAKMLVYCIGIALIVVVGIGGYAAFFLDAGVLSTTLKVFFIAVLAGFGAFWQFVVLAGIREINDAVQDALDAPKKRDS